MVVDVPRCGPMQSPRIQKLVPIPGPRMERETLGQRPGPNLGHPQAVEPEIAELVLFLRNGAPSSTKPPAAVT